MTDSVNGAGRTSGNWFKQASSKTTKALKGFLHFGSVRKTSGKSPVKDARIEYNKPEPTPVHSRSIQQAKASELASIRAPVTPRNSPTAKTPPLPLLKADPVQEQIYNAEVKLMALYESRATLDDAVSRATALKEKTGRQFNAISRKAGLSPKSALGSMKFTAARNRFFKAVQLERTTEKALQNLDIQIKKQEIAVDRLRAAEDRQAERELKQLLAGG